MTLALRAIQGSTPLLWYAPAVAPGEYNRLLASQERAESPDDLELAIPLKRDSTARRVPMMEAMVKTARAAPPMNTRFAKERRGEDSDMVASWCWALVAADECEALKR